MAGKTRALRDFTVRTSVINFDHLNDGTTGDFSFFEKHRKRKLRLRHSYDNEYGATKCTVLVVQLASDFIMRVSFAEFEMFYDEEPKYDSWVGDRLAMNVDFVLDEITRVQL